MNNIVHYPISKGVTTSKHTKEPGIIRISCVTHKNCLDGIFSAVYIKMCMHVLELAFNREGRHMEFEIAFIEKQYGVDYTHDQLVRMAIGDIVVMVDMSMDIEQFTKIEHLLTYCNIVWIDHHVTSHETAKHILDTVDKDKVLINIATDRCAAMILGDTLNEIIQSMESWPSLKPINMNDYGINIEGLNAITKFVNDRDIWSNEYPETEVVTAYLYLTMLGSADPRSYANRVAYMVNSVIHNDLPDIQDMCIWVHSCITDGLRLRL